MAAALFGCGKKGPTSRPTPVVSNPAAVRAAAALDEADGHFQAGRYSEAAAAYESAISQYPSSESPEVLFRQALSHLLESAVQGRSRAAPLLRKLAEAEAESPLGVASKLILDLLEDVRSLARSNDANERKVKQLSEELEKLKKIDMRRRPPKPER